MRLVLASLLPLLLITSCEENSNSFETIELELCDQPTESGVWEFENCVEWPLNSVESCAAAGAPEYEPEQEVQFHYSIQNLDTVALTIPMSGTPGVEFNIEQLGWRGGGIDDSIAWELILGPQDSFTRSLETVVTDSTGSPPPDGYYVFSAQLSGSIDSTTVFPVEYGFMLRSAASETVPQSFDLFVCWHDEDLDTLVIFVNLPQSGHLRLSISLVGGGFTEVLMDGMSEAGTHVYGCSVLGLAGGTYAVVLDADAYRRELRFEL